MSPLIEIDEQMTQGGSAMSAASDNGTPSGVVPGPSGPGTTVTGAQSLIRTLVNSKVDVCFANPGTSEMHFVAALDAVPEMRGVLALFEGVVTGAADGYARMTGRPAATLLHLARGSETASPICTTPGEPARRS
jgi:hypothetical protein